MIKYNKIYPKFTYNGVLISDISHRFTIQPTLITLAGQYYNISISENSTPESVSMRVYGTTDYWWLILAINNVIDPFYDWLMSDEEVTKYCILSYDDINSYHHYEDSDFNMYDTDSPEADRTPITNLEWEIHLNDKKRRINVIASKYLPIIESELTNITKQYKPSAQGDV
jgi:hypothetical protein